MAKQRSGSKGRTASLRLVDEPQMRVKLTIKVSGRQKVLSRLLEQENVDAVIDELERDLKTLKGVSLDLFEVQHEVT